VHVANKYVLRVDNLGAGSAVQEHNQKRGDKCP
jgi:hypothetical protein